LLIAGKYEELEKLAAEYRAMPKRLRGGNSFLYHFYPGLGFVGKDDVYTSSLPAKQKQVHLERWLTKNPESVAARIALATFWNDQGWDARGGRPAKYVSDEQWREFRGHLTTAKRHLSRVDPNLDPYAYYLLSAIALGQSASRQELDLLYQRSIDAFPDFFHFYATRSNALLEQWFGEPGEVAALAKSVLEKPGGENGLIAYAYIAMPLLVNDANKVFNSTGLAWSSVRDGYKARERRFGLRNRDWNALCYFAALAGDAAVAKEALGHIGEEWDPALWTSRDNFDGAVQWINTTVSAR
jgi:hypothetical protein